MFGCTKLINNIFTLILTLLLLVSLVLSLVLYSTVEVLSDRENVRSWLKSDEVRELYAEYVTDEIYDVIELSGLEDLIDQEDATDSLNEALDDERVDELIDELVDNTYDWLEGDLELVESNNDKPIDTTDFIAQITTVASELFGVDELESIPTLLDLFGIDDITSINVPDTYQKLLDLPKKLFIATAVIAVVLLFSSSSVRNGLLIIGLVSCTAAVVILFGPDYLSTELGADLLRQISGIDLDSLPDIENQPEFIRELYKQAEGAIMSITRRYAMYVGGAGLVVVVLSQLGFKSEEVEVDEKDEEDKNDDTDDSEDENEEDSEDSDDGDMD